MNLKARHSSFLREGGCAKQSAEIFAGSNGRMPASDGIDRQQFVKAEERKRHAMKNVILSEKPNVRNSHVQFDEHDAASEMPRHRSFCKLICVGFTRVFILGLLLVLPCRADSISHLGGEYVSQVETFVSGGVVNFSGSNVLKHSQEHRIYLTTDNSESWLNTTAQLLSLKLEVPSWIEDYEVCIDYVYMIGQAQRNLGCVFDKHSNDHSENLAPMLSVSRSTTAPITCNGKFRIKRNYGERSRTFVITALDTYRNSTESITTMHTIAKEFVVTQFGYGFKVDYERSGATDYIVTGMHTGEGSDIDDDAVLTIPNGMTKIAESAFTECEFPATKVVLPRQLETIGNRAFSGCTSLTDVDFTDSGKSRLSIGDYAFEGCTGLTSVYFPACVASVGKGAFANCTNLKEFKVDAMNSLTLSVRNGLLCDVLGRKILACPPALTSVTIPSSITGIAPDAFKGCSQLKSVSVPSGNLDRIVQLMRNSGFEVNGVKFNGEEYLDDGSHSAKVGDYTWYFFVTNGISIINPPTESRPAIEPAPNGKITIPSVLGGHPVASISGYAMQKDMGDEANWHLTEVEFPKSIFYIGQYAFARCDELSKITIPDGVSNFVIGDGAFSGCALTGVELPEGVISIGREAFSGCSGLTSMAIPSSMASIDSRAFYGCSGLTSINVDSENEWYCSIDGVLYDKDATELICCPGGLVLVTIPSGVTSIGDDAFCGCSELASVTIPSSVESIGECAFEGCDKLATVYVDVGEADRVRALMLGKGIDVSKLKFVGPYEISFDLNFETDESIDSWCVDHGDAIGELPMPTRVGYDFIGWFSSDDGGDEINENTVVESAMTLYAHWRPIMYWVVFDANGGSGTMADQSYTYNVAQSLAKNQYYLNGFKFVGWAETRDGMVKYGDQALVENLAEIQDQRITLYAIWDEASYAVRFDGNGGVGSMDNQTFVVGMAQELFECEFKRAGYAFEGWATEPDGIVVYKDKESVKNLTMTNGATVSLYAVWEPVEIAVPVFNPLDGTVFMDMCEVSITCATEGATIYYRVGAKPKATDKFRYTKPFEITETSEIWAIAQLGDRSSEAVCATLTKGDVLTIATAVDAVGVDSFETDEQMGWKPVECDFAKVGATCARSGEISDDQCSRMAAKINGAGVFTFQWKSSCEEDALQEFDHAEFIVDGVEIARIDGITNWKQVSVELVDIGKPHTVEWVYVKDESECEGEDCVWIDEVKWELKTAGGAVIADVTALKEAFGAESSVVRNLTSEEELVKFNDFLGECGITAANQISEKQKQYAYESFKLSAITVEPQLFEDEPKLKIDEFKPSEGSWSVTISLKAGEEAIAMAKKALEEHILVGTELAEITAKPDIVASPSEDGASLTFTIVPPEGDKAFMAVRL